MLVQLTALDAFFLRGCFEHRRQLWVLQRRAVARLVAVVASAGLLPEHADCAELVRNGGKIAISRQVGTLALADRLADVEARQIAHRKGSHGHAEVAQRAVDLLRRGALFQQKFRLAAVLKDHAVADETVADADHHRDLLQLLADGHGGGEHFIAGLLATYYFQQPHDVGRAEEMQADDVFRSLGKGGDGIQVQRRSVRGENGARLAHRIQLLEDLLLDAHLLEYRFDHHVDVRQRSVFGDTFDQLQALFHGIDGQAAALDAGGVSIAGALQAALQRFVIDFQKLHRHTGIGKAQGDTDTHGAAANNCGTLDSAGFHLGRQIVDLARLALGEEGMDQRTALR